MPLAINLRKIGFLCIILYVRAFEYFPLPAQQRSRNSLVETCGVPENQAPIEFYDIARIARNIHSNQGELECTAQLPPVPHLVVLLPAYNEVERIGDTIETYQSYLENSNQWMGKAQILVVDDGSEDGTSDFVQSRKSEGKAQVHCISLSHNRGKGAAISFGIDYLATKYDESACLILIADADGSADISCMDKMVKSLGHLIASQTLSEESFWHMPALVVGNRGYRGSSYSRSLLRWGFRTTVRVLCGDLRVSDSQCGFKLLTLAAAQRLYADLSLKRWSHDVEVLYRAREWSMPIAEETVEWQDKDGSKLITSPFSAVQVSSIMLLEVLQMQIEYVMGRKKLLSDKEKINNIT